MSKNEESIGDFVSRRNAEKLLFTAGPASLVAENVTGLRACFGRGDSDYADVESRVMLALQKMSGHSNVVRMQGSASLALEVMAVNFLFGRVLIVDSGYYSQRLHALSNSAMRSTKQISQIESVSWDQLDEIQGKFDWIFSCYTETSRGLKIPVEKLRATADRLGAKLMLDATASIGLELQHELADVIAYSSCKGLFGLTGAAFVAYHESPNIEVDSFYLSLTSHVGKMMTGPYHAIASMDEILKNHDFFKAAVIENKRIYEMKMSKYLTLPQGNQPLLCTHVNCKVGTTDPRAILYAPRTNFGGSVICHLGEVHLGSAARGEIISVLDIQV